MILKPIRIEKHSEIDPRVELNVRPGRTLKALKALVLGDYARVRSGSVLYAHSRIGPHLQTGHNVVIREENHIGSHVSIWNNSTIDYGCRIGNRVKIHSNCYVAQFTILEDDVFLAPGVTCANDLYPRTRHADDVMQGPIIRKGAVIGVNSTLLPGIEIGAGALIGAGSVVTRNVPAGAVVWGNPARVFKRSKKELRWPTAYTIADPVRNRFYKKTLSGRDVQL